MVLSFNWSAVGIMFAIFVQTIAVVWHASKLTNEVKNTKEELKKIDKELEKRDAKISALFTKTDHLFKEVYILKGGLNGHGFKFPQGEEDILS